MWRLAGAIFMLPFAILQSTSISQVGALHTFGALLFVAVSQRMPLDSLMLVTKGVCDPGLMTL